MFGFGSKKLVLSAPVEGKIVDITEVEDPVFAGKMMGDGFAVEPAEGVNTVCAPCDAKVMLVPDTMHAVALEKNGVELLLHVGIDTVSMRGKGFEALVKAGDKVDAGQPLLKFDSNKIAEAGKSSITMLVVTNQDDAVESAEKNLVNSEEVMTLTLK
ncbi:PTS sugar transporter subunit IIA [Schwartzia succinivorans]|jgi:glucose-specific phosphotransferase system IIA component|uniref:PTS system, glucose-specific IIA component n=1 Tax=Schwartzia succinivorans DSM 10502 TaxID=1123243 RepID=A0A1M4SPP5_9FIRM|nr:PTS glucose transporter subunit IIA [Schwartzia succinivorans]SHE34223.1 PTS system, glucose-specific IIA component [Schwartzia succinivorans DSM 10502]